MQTNLIDVNNFELEVKLIDGAERKYDYRRAGDQVSARMTTRESLGRKVRQSDTAAIEAVRDLLSQIAPSPQMQKKDLLERSRAALHLDDTAIEELEVEIGFADGSEVEAESKKGFFDSWKRHAELSSLP